MTITLFSCLDRCGLHAFYMLCFLYMVRPSLHVHGFSLYRGSLCIHPMYRGV